MHTHTKKRDESHQDIVVWCNIGDNISAIMARDHKRKHTPLCKKWRCAYMLAETICGKERITLTLWQKRRPRYPHWTRLQGWIPILAQHLVDPSSPPPTFDPLLVHRYLPVEWKTGRGTFHRGKDARRRVWGWWVGGEWGMRDGGWGVGNGEWGLEVGMGVGIWTMWVLFLGYGFSGRTYSISRILKDRAVHISLPSVYWDCSAVIRGSWNFEFEELTCVEVYRYCISRVDPAVDEYNHEENSDPRHDTF